jgi:hypothetical protein
MGAIDNPYQASLVTNMAQSPVGHYANATSHISLRKTIVTSPLSRLWECNGTPKPPRPSMAEEFGMMDLQKA